jgi:sRNA-binding protein
MDRAQYSACIGEAMTGKQLSKDERKLEFCVAAKLCSQKAKSREEAVAICKQPKPPKPEGEKKTHKSKCDCPELNPAELIPVCEEKLTKMVKSGELPTEFDVSGVCQLILG